ncbi:MAG TPA: lysoplasmalogenase, partial [Acidimicrobiales bacterium]|nr:lysoplasmalogenase [Acidimicrobiales bacterium]
MPHRATVPFVAAAAADAAMALTGQDRVRRFTKPLLMPLLMLGRESPVQRALALGGLGDVALLGSSDAAFTGGLISFLAGHVAWVTALRPGSRGVIRRRPALVAPYIAAWIGLNAYLWGRTGRNRIPVLVYSGALLSTALAALDTGDRVTTAGGVLFMASDSLLALERFGELPLPGHEGIVMTTYAAAQACLAHESDVT